MTSYRLKTLGALSLIADPPDRIGTGLQRNRLGISIVVAAAGPSGISREKLAEMFWPESDSERSRNALNQALFGLRRATAPQTLVEGTDILRFNSAICSADFLDLERAAREGLHEKVISLYTGPFLEGIRFRSNAPLERWIEHKRDSIDDTFSKALRASFDDARARGDLKKMLARAKARAELVPYDASAAEALVRAFCETGNLELARRQVLIYERLVTGDLEGTPDPRVASALAKCDTVEEYQAPELVSSEEQARPPSLAPDLANVAVSESTPPVPLHGVPRGSRKLRMWVVAGSVLLIATSIGAVVWRNLTVGKIAATQSGETIAIFPFCVKGDAPNKDLSDGMVDLIDASLSGDAGPRPLDSHSTIGATSGKPCDLRDDQARQIARRLGATYLLLGDVVSAGQSVVLRAKVGRVSAQSFGREISAQGALDSLNTTIGNFTAQVQAAIVNEPDARMPDILSRSTPALKSYLRGRSLWRSGQKRAAVDEFITALDADSTFALAGLGLSEAGGFAWGGDYEAARRRLIQASEIRGKLSSRDEALLHALIGYPPHRRSDAEAFHDWEHAVDLAPESPTAWYEYGDRLFHIGAAIGRTNSLADAKRAFERAIALDSSSALPIAHMVEVSVIEKNVEAVQKYARLYAAIGATADSRVFVEWRAAQFLTDARRLGAIHARLPEISISSLQRIAGTSQLENVDLGFGMDAINELARREAAPLWQFDASVRLHDRAINDRNWDLADRALRKIGRSQIVMGLFSDVPSVDALRMTDLIFGGVDSTAARSVAARLANSSAIPPSDDASAMRVLGENCALGLWQASRNRAAAKIALNRITALKPAIQPDVYPQNGSLCIAMIQAEMAIAEHRISPKPLIDRVDSLAALGVQSYGMGFASLETAMLYEKIGDHANALRAVRRRRYDWTEAVRYLTSSRNLERALH
ncbi:MAG: BTAD domain-containing putative transcriptional regulator [Gemmatimonadaceae bacterium]